MLRPETNMEKIIRANYLSQAIEDQFKYCGYNFKSLSVLQKF